MNANEIADELEMVMDGYAIAITASGMLRQQQAEIDNLASIKYVNGVTISNLYAEIEALKERLKNPLQDRLDAIAARVVFGEMNHCDPLCNPKICDCFKKEKK